MHPKPLKPVACYGLSYMVVALGLASGCTPSKNKPDAQRASKPDARAQTVTLTAQAVANAKLTVVSLGDKPYLPILQTTALITADPQKIAQVGSYMAGRVAGIDVRLGEQVDKNQPLIQVDSIEMHQVSTEYRTALAQARQTDDALARQKKLASEHINAAQDLVRAQTAADSAHAILDEAEEHLGFLGLSHKTVAALRMGRTPAVLRSVIRAPIAGRVDALSVNLGQVIGGKEQLMTIMDTNPVWATLRLFESDLNDVQVGADVTIRVTAYPGRAFIGKLAVVSDLIDSTTRSIEARVRLENPDGLLKPGMSTVAEIAIVSNPTIFWLPADAVQTDGAQKVVFVATTASSFTMCPVAIGQQRGLYVPILSGLSPGAHVVTEGAFLLRGEIEKNKLGED